VTRLRGRNTLNRITIPHGFCHECRGCDLAQVCDKSHILGRLNHALDWHDSPFFGGHGFPSGWLAFPLTGV
jgi:hypothetical protein